MFYDIWAELEEFSKRRSLLSGSDIPVCKLGRKDLKLQSRNVESSNSSLAQPVIQK